MNVWEATDGRCKVFNQNEVNEGPVYKMWLSLKEPGRHAGHPKRWKLLPHAGLKEPGDGKVRRGCLRGSVASEY